MNASATAAQVPFLLLPTTPWKTSRYEAARGTPWPKRTTLFPRGPHKTSPSNPISTGVLDPINETIYDRLPLPSGWERHVHLDGKPYYRDRDRLIVTELDVSNRDLEEMLGLIYQSLVKDLEKIKEGPAAVQTKKTRKLTETEEIYVMQCKDKSMWEYYFVDHGREDIFWVKDIDFVDLGGYPEDTSYDTLITQHYYCHLENFPCHNKLPPGATKMLRCHLIFSATDRITFGKRTPICSQEEAKLLVEFLEHFEDNPDDFTSTFKTWYVARLLTYVYQLRNIYCYGTPNALVDRSLRLLPANGPSMHTDVPAITLLDAILGLLSLSAYWNYLHRIQEVWAEGIVSIFGWQDLVKGLLSEWSDSNLLATVTLSANMAFLALNPIAVARVFSIISTFLSLGSIITGLHHLWKHRYKTQSNAISAATYFREQMRFTGNLRPLAWFLALPLVLLSWSLAWFAAAVGVYAFNGLDGNSAGGVAVAILVLALMLMAYVFFAKVIRVTMR
ncbi:hypothetical protein CPB83DRAFT_889149 [Crepidotus variabilis]|uniref:WW domain-containing protein n=1 Tax=Crepidotus variabilis TaxID=179855 RepID=A0A9P6JUD8_9AGAR|nr:hypothetical protein CPB83DRAFT_889149 [Crepidotus variabilis]